MSSLTLCLRLKVKLPNPDNSKAKNLNTSQAWPLAQRRSIHSLQTWLRCGCSLSDFRKKTPKTLQGPWWMVKNFKAINACLVTQTAPVHESTSWGFQNWNRRCPVAHLAIRTGSWLFQGMTPPTPLVSTSIVNWCYYSSEMRNFFDYQIRKICNLIDNLLNRLKISDEHLSEQVVNKPSNELIPSDSPNEFLLMMKLDSPKSSYLEISEVPITFGQSWLPDIRRLMTNVQMPLGSRSC